MEKHGFNCCLPTLFSYAGRSVAWVIWVYRSDKRKPRLPLWVSEVFVCLDGETLVWWHWSSNCVYSAFIQCLFGERLGHILSEMVSYPGYCVPEWVWMCFKTVVLGMGYLELCLSTSVRPGVQISFLLVCIGSQKKTQEALCVLLSLCISTRGYPLTSVSFSLEIQIWLLY